MILLPNKFRVSLYICVSFILASCSNEVNYTPPAGSKDTAITHYSYDKIVIDGETHITDVIILPNGKVTSWGFDRETHRITPRDLQSHITEDVKTLIIGAGLHGEGFLDDDAALFVKERQAQGMTIHFVATIEAVNLFNSLPKKGILTFIHIRN